jgi:hypothetical protein
MTQLEQETLTAVKRAANKIAGVDWEQRRYELVRDILPTIIQVNANATSESEDEIINIAIRTADKVIAALKN